MNATDYTKQYQSLERELTRLFKSLKKDIGDEYRANEEDEIPGMQITVGATVKDGELTWNYQTGDNSYTGGAYGHANWGVVSLYRKSNSAEVAKDCVDQISESIGQLEWIGGDK